MMRYSHFQSQTVARIENERDGERKKWNQQLFMTYHI